MCVCTPEKRTPFCGKPGCEWPESGPYTIAPNGLIGNYMVKDGRGRIVATGLTYDGAENYVRAKLSK